MDRRLKTREHKTMFGRRWAYAFKTHFIPHEGNDHHPHVLRPRGLIGFSLLLIAFKGAAVVVPFAVAIVTHADETVIPITPTTVIELSNRVRASLELPPLVTDERLSQAAQAKADDMAKRGYFAHASLDGSTALDRIRQTGYPTRYAAENLAVHFMTALDVQRGWMNSPSHRSILLDERYEDSGVGVAYGFYEGRETTFVVHLFGTQTEGVAPESEPRLVTNAVIASASGVAGTDAGRVLAQTFSEERVDGAVREFYLYAVAFLTALLLLTLVIRFRILHVA
ncbi:MAG: CAP domain-containing protein, partial [Candidatus Uhrbacteria bacterium]|nr:CAP domain-containing protein [Candidatus Uhrbacteria bacterium]